ncbi:hypothetical protein [Bacillus inaquosorum]|uniref:hypothetical protein n=1 Tax=Bacillus inaquosorum TaxID=483913 RepID=UPI00227DA379|nr:hypothetical protein [Bacillus inaquosorum]MCY7931783.1 hypothetical protein [Bacillus inaquosorum]MCY8769704.1 hypothetical protein [Bacillus inaquosorum]
MAIKLIKTYSPNENATRLKQQEQDAQTIEDALNGQASGLSSHIIDPKAHAATQITYEGTNVDTALTALNKYVDNLVIEASKGDSNAEVVAARTNYDGTTDTSLKARLDRYAQKTDNGQNFKLTSDLGVAKKVLITGDLNDITEAGVYWCEFNSGKWDLLNTPIQASGWLEVIKGSTSTGTLQRYTPYRSSVTQNVQVTYFRNYGIGSSAWGLWATTADKTQTDAAISSITSQKLNTSTTKITDASISGNDYPIGITIQEIATTATGFPWYGGGSSAYGYVETHKLSNTRLVQYFYEIGSAGQLSKGGWARHWHNDVGWSQWYSLFGNASWCNVSVTNEQVLTQSYTQKVKFDRVISDSHSQFNTYNNRFTAKVRGMYMVGAGLYIYRKKQYNNVEFNLYKNGTLYKMMHQNRQDPYNPATDEFNQGHYASGVTVPLEIGDYLELYIFVGAGQDLTISSRAGWYNYFDIYRIGDIPMGI